MADFSTRYSNFKKALHYWENGKGVTVDNEVTLDQFIEEMTGQLHKQTALYCIMGFGFGVLTLIIGIGFLLIGIATYLLLHKRSLLKDIPKMKKQYLAELEFADHRKKQRELNNTAGLLTT